MIDRWFYEIQLETNLLSYENPPIKGLLQITLDGLYDSYQYPSTFFFFESHNSSKFDPPPPPLDFRDSFWIFLIVWRVVEEYSDLSDLANIADTYLVLRIPAKTGIGGVNLYEISYELPDISPIQNLTIVPFYIDEAFSFTISSIRVVDLDNFVYESDYRSPITFSSTGKSMWGFDAIASPDAAAAQDVLTVSVEAISDLQEPTVLYVYLDCFDLKWFDSTRYELAGPNNQTVWFSDAFSLCNVYGGVLASPAHMMGLIAATSGVNCPWAPPHTLAYGFYNGPPASSNVCIIMCVRFLGFDWCRCLYLWRRHKMVFLS